MCFTWASFRWYVTYWLMDITAPASTISRAQCIHCITVLTLPWGAVQITINITGELNRDVRNLGHAKIILHILKSKRTVRDIRPCEYGTCTLLFIALSDNGWELGLTWWLEPGLERQRRWAIFYHSTLFHVFHDARRAYPVASTPGASLF